MPYMVVFLRHSDQVLRVRTSSTCECDGQFTQEKSLLQRDFGLADHSLWHLPGQAYRYVHQAQNTPGPVAVPEPKSVFTVKLSGSLIRQVRQHARRQDSPISQWVEAALRRSLKLPRGHG
jgi:hypothetical protein